jgi:hypothetical protein
MSVYLVGIIAFLLGALLACLGGLLLSRRLGRLRDQGARAEAALAYARGKEEGAREVMARFTVSYEEYADENERYLSKSIETGYYSQLLLDGLPLLDKSKTVVSTVKRSKDANVDLLLSSVSGLVADLVARLGSKGIKAVRKSLPRKPGK